MDEAILVWIHARASPALDAAFLLSNELGLPRLLVPLVLAVIAWQLARKRRREALALTAVGLATWLLPELAKVVFARPRPALWPRLITASSLSFPSAHAVAGAAVYPLLGWMALRSGPGRGRGGYASGLALGLFIGVGRCYLGVHWPSDVLAGWVLGIALSAGAVRWLERERPPEGSGPVTAP
jgi:undecaprenyl-diphosphatase